MEQHSSKEDKQKQINIDLYFHYLEININYISSYK